MIDDEVKHKGHLEDHFEFLEPKMIKDPSARKPADWVDESEIDDPDDKKPEDFPDRYMIDPNAKMPKDWNEAEDGLWDPPRIWNDKYTGEWKPRRIRNPLYKGEWPHPMIPNPNYEKDDTLYHCKHIGGVGIEVWQVTSGTFFDNIFVGDSVEEANEHKKLYWKTIEKERKMYEKNKDKIEKKWHQKKHGVTDEEEEEEEWREYYGEEHEDL